MFQSDVGQLREGAEEAFQSITSEAAPLLERLGEPLFTLSGQAISIASIISFFVFVLLAFGLSAFLQRAMGRVYRRRGLDEGVQYALNRLLHYLILAVGVFLALDNLGISITALAGLGAILAVGLGFGLQNIAQNFVSGLILLLERPIKKGDFVEVGDTRGTVREIHARATVVTTLDNVDILVPNGQFITEAVINETYAERRIRVRVGVGVAYGSDTRKVQQALQHVAATHNAILKDPAPKVWFVDFGDSSLDFALLFWISEPLVQYQVESEVRFAIDAAFREHNIEIPFPQRDLHVRSGLEAWG